MTGKVRPSARGHARSSGFRLLLALLLLGTTSVACRSVEPHPPDPAPTPSEYLVGPPDQLRVTILPEPEIASNVTVRPDGMISVDLVGDIPASGRTVDAISRDIEERISRFKRDARATVAVVSAQSSTVTLLGEVRSPTNFALQRDTRVIEAIGQQGGLTVFATWRIAHLIRTDGVKTEIIDVDIGAIKKGDLRTNYLLREGDLLIVPPSIFAQIGYVVQQFMFPFQPVLGIGTTFASFAGAF
jgi:polysaccharide export outer membrane protein